MEKCSVVSISEDMRKPKPSETELARVNVVVMLKGDLDPMQSAKWYFWCIWCIEKHFLIKKEKNADMAKK